MSIISSALGRYEPEGNPRDADVVVGHSFGTSTDPESVNRELATMVALYASEENLPTVADRNLVNAMPPKSRDVDLVVEGQVSNTIGQGVGTWGTLLATKQFMEQEGLKSALMIGQAHHIGRIAMQASKLGITSILPKNLPKQFDPESSQRWTRSLGLWLPREILGAAVLKIEGRL